jgi:predicted metal-dependent hydrolase
VEVLYPVGRPPEDVETFLQNNGAWLLNEKARVAPLRSLRRIRQRSVGEILLHGMPT